MVVREVKDYKEKLEIYKQRYKVFITEKKYPAEMYPSGLMMDPYDEEAIHIGCYRGNTLLGFLSMVLKSREERLLVEDYFDITAEEDSAEVMRLVIIKDEVPVNELSTRGKIIGLLLSKIIEVCERYRLRNLYLISLSETKKLYGRFGFTQIGEFKLFAGISYECPMKLDIEKTKSNLLEGIIMEERIKTIVSNIIEVDVNDFDMTTDLVEELDVDSMMALEIMATLENEFHITFNEDDVRKFTNVQEIVSVVKFLIEDSALVKN